MEPVFFLDGQALRKAVQLQTKYLADNIFRGIFCPLSFVRRLAGRLSGERGPDLDGRQMPDYTKPDGEAPAEPVVLEFFEGFLRVFIQ